MKYYVPVGAGGLFFKVGMAVTGILGSLVYWRASRRRAATSLMTIPSSEGYPARVIRQPAGYRGNYARAVPGHRPAGARPWRGSIADATRRGASSASGRMARARAGRSARRS